MIYILSSSLSPVSELREAMCSHFLKKEPFMVVWRCESQWFSFNFESFEAYMQVEKIA